MRRSSWSTSDEAAGVMELLSLETAGTIGAEAEYSAGAGVSE